MAVIGHEAKQTERIFGERCRYALQEKQLGTGHTILVDRDLVNALDLHPQTVMVCYGDTPIISSEVLARLLLENYSKQATVTFLTAVSHWPSNFGRVVRDPDGHAREIFKMKRGYSMNLS